MPKRLRFTGENPPVALWQRYPNWRNAIEEEVVDGQDETTLMPHEIQSYIGEYTSFSAGTVRLRDGRVFPAFLEIGDGVVHGCQVNAANGHWRIYYSPPDRRWVSFLAEWLPESERPPSVSFSDDSVFPLTIYMSVPWREDAAKSAYEIGTDGQMREIAS